MGRTIPSFRIATVIEEVGTVIDGIEYNLRFYTQDANLYNQYVPIADKIINSFEFIQ